MPEKCIDVVAVSGVMDQTFYRGVATVIVSAHGMLVSEGPRDGMFGLHVTQAKPAS